GLSRSEGQVAHVLLTRSPLRHTSGLPLRHASLDLHALGTPPAFILSQDQTLHRTIVGPRARVLSVKVCAHFGSKTSKRGLRALIAHRDTPSARESLRCATEQSLLSPAFTEDGALLAFGTLFSCQGASQTPRLTSCVSVGSAILSRPRYRRQPGASVMILGRTGFGSAGPLRPPGTVARARSYANHAERRTNRRFPARSVTPANVARGTSYSRRSSPATLTAPWSISLLASAPEMPKTSRSNPGRLTGSSSGSVAVGISPGVPPLRKTSSNSRSASSAASGPWSRAPTSRASRRLASAGSRSPAAIADSIDSTSCGSRSAARRNHCTITSSGMLMG